MAPVKTPVALRKGLDVSMWADGHGGLNRYAAKYQQAASSSSSTGSDDSNATVTASKPKVRQSATAPSVPQKSSNFDNTASTLDKEASSIDDGISMLEKRLQGMTAPVFSDDDPLRFQKMAEYYMNLASAQQAIEQQKKLAKTSHGQVRQKAPEPPKPEKKVEPQKPEKKIEPQKAEKKIELQKPQRKIDQGERSITQQIPPTPPTKHTSLQERFRPASANIESSGVEKSRHADAQYPGRELHDAQKENLKVSQLAAVPPSSQKPRTSASKDVIVQKQRPKPIQEELHGFARALDEMRKKATSMALKQSVENEEITPQEAIQVEVPKPIKGHTALASKAETQLEYGVDRIDHAKQPRRRNKGMDADLHHLPEWLQKDMQAGTKQIETQTAAQTQKIDTSMKETKEPVESAMKSKLAELVQRRGINPFEPRKLEGTDNKSAIGRLAPPGPKENKRLQVGEWLLKRFDSFATLSYGPSQAPTVNGDDGEVFVAKKVNPIPIQGIKERGISGNRTVVLSKEIEVHSKPGNQTTILSKETEVHSKPRQPLSSIQNDVSEPRGRRLRAGPASADQAKDSESRRADSELTSIGEEEKAFTPSQEALEYWQLEPGGTYDEPNRKYLCNVCHKKKDYKSHAKLIEHKKRRHEYCEKCEQDFAIPDDLIEHLVASNKHFACMICHLDFGSLEGLGGHYGTAHSRAKSPVTCIACGTKFANGAAMLVHLETDKCRTLTADAFTKTRYMLAVVHRNGIIIGGDKEESFEEKEKLEKLRRVSAIVLGEDPNAIAASSERRVGPRKNPFSVQYDPSPHLSSSGNYTCPYGGCTKSFKQEDLHKFIRHLRNGHFRFFSCVACYHTFSTPSALLAHMESYTRNCSAAKSDLFDFSVTSISGGTLQCSGKNLDGSKRIVGAKPTSAELLESVIEGLDVDSLAV